MANHSSTPAMRTPCIKRQKDMKQKMSPPGEKWRTTTNSSRKNEAARPKQSPVVDVSGDESKRQCCKEKYCIGTWNVRSMNQGKLDVVKQEMARVNTDILGISELK